MPEDKGRDAASPAMARQYHAGCPTVGVLAGWQAYHGVPHGFLYKVFRGLRAAAHDQGCNLMLACGMGGPFGIVFRPAWPVPGPDSDFIPVGPWNTDGLIVVTPLLSEARSRYIQDLRAGGHPVIFIGCGESGPAVAVDNAGGIRQAVAHLVRHGHRRIAFIAGEQGFVDDSRERLLAYRSAVDEFDLGDEGRLIVNGRHNAEGGQDAIRELLASRVTFTAVVASNDESAIGAMQALGEAGLRIPEDVAVIGFDDVLLDMAQAPPLTSVHYPATDVGYQAMGLLLERIAGRRAGDEVVRMPARLVVRDSCGCQPGALRPKWEGSNESPSPTVWATQVAGMMSQAVRDETQRVTEAVRSPARHLRPGEIHALCRQLADAFVTDLQRGARTSFLSTLLDILGRVETACDDAHAWQAAIMTLEAALPALASMQDQPEWRGAGEELCRLAGVVVSRGVRQEYARVVVDQQGISDQMGQLTAHLLVTVDETRIFSTLAEYLPGVGFRNAYIVFFEAANNDPSAWGTLLNGAGADPHRFPCREFPPPGLCPANEPFQLALLPLVIQDEAVGFVAFDGVNLSICAEIVLQLAAAFKSVRLYQEAAEGRQLAEEANRLKSSFLSLVSHELRTPLNLIVGLSDILLKARPDLPEMPARYREDVEKIHASAQHLGWLIRDVLDLASSQVGQLRLTCQALDLTEMLAMVASAGERMAREKGLQWETHIPTQLPRVLGDRARLQQVALNLLSNAVKFTTQGQVTLRVEKEADTVKVSVSDTGLGIPPAEQSSIFDEFRQSKRTAARGYGGLGLGLAICKRLVELHGGAIGVVSSGDEQAGSTFYFRLPALVEPVLLATPPSRTQTTLVLAQEAVSGERLCANLGARGFEVELWSIETRPQWLMEIVAAPPGAVVLDASLATQRGWEVMKVLRENPATEDVPVLFYALAAETDDGTLLEMDYLTKPLNAGALTQALAQRGLMADQDRGDKTIIVVDDEPGSLEMHVRLVQAQSPSYHVLKARNGREALEMIRQQLPHVVLLDLMMPDLDGFGVLEAMREAETTRDIPVVVLTAQVLTERDMARLNQGVAAVLGKGLFRAEEMLAHLGAALARSHKAGNETRRLVRKAMAYIHEHYAESLARGDIARYVAISDSYLARCFQQEVGVPPMVYLSRYRVKQAKELLANADHSVTEVALAVGFSSASAFTQAFQREVGVSPRAYRKGERPS